MISSLYIIPCERQPAHRVFPLAMSGRGRSLTLIAMTRERPISSRSAAHRAALVLSGQFEKLGFDLREQARRNETIAEYSGLSRNRRQACVRPFVDVVLRN